MFRDEDLAYALRLGQAGVPIEFHLHPGAPHEFAFIAFNTHRRPAPSSTALFRAPDAPVPHRWLACSQP
jgi:acetyl esterase/lipase